MAVQREICLVEGFQLETEAVWLRQLRMTLLIAWAESRETCRVEGTLSE